MVAILEVGAFISSLSVGKIGDIIGRRKTILYGSMIFFVGGALQTFATGMPMMMLGRIIAGLGVGTLSTIVPVYQSEISPPHNRGKLACIEFSGNIIGYTTSVWVDYFCGFIESDYSWRIPLAMQCIMGDLLGIGSLVIVESPRYGIYGIQGPFRGANGIPDGCSTTIMTRKALSSSPICMVVVISTTTRRGTSIARLR